MLIAVFLVQVLLFGLASLFVARSFFISRREGVVRFPRLGVVIHRAQNPQRFQLALIGDVLAAIFFGSITALAAYCFVLELSRSLYSGG